MGKSNTSNKQGQIKKLYDHNLEESFDITSFGTLFSWSMWLLP